jgi:putative tryptophan/tyrosine transport system substrate-binding protein
MRRRDFIIRIIGSAAAAWPLAAVGQGVKQAPRIGVLMELAESDSLARSNIAALQRGLRRLGWIDGRNLEMTYRWTSNDPVMLWRFAKALAGLHPDVIVTHSTPGVSTLLGQTRSIPIIFVSIPDPVGEGFVESFARPRGNVTGFTDFESSMTGKWVELLKMIAPDLTRVAFLFNPQATAGAGAYFMQAIDAAAAIQKVKIVMALVHDGEGIDSEFAALSREPGTGVVVLPDIFTASYHQLIIAKAAHYRVPTIYNYRFMVQRGGLISYGVDLDNLFERAATYVDRILKGAVPADLPIQAPTRFELAINLKTAKTLGLTVPDQLIVVADDLVE